MGNKYSNVNVNAKVTLHGTSNTVDGVVLSYKRNSCFGGRRVVATFTFPKGGWQQVSEGILRNSSSKGANISLDRLRKKDGDTSVRITFLAGKVPVYRTQLALADLLKRLRCTVRGNEAVLLFSLTGGKAEGGKAQGNAFNTLFCNGRRCGEAPRVEVPDPPPAEGGNETEAGEGVEDSPGHGGDGQGLDESPRVSETGIEVEDSPGHGGDGQELDESHGLEQDVVPGEEEEPVIRQPTPQEREGRHNEEVPAYHYVATPSSYGSGGRGRGGLMNTLGVCATVVVYLLILYNAWVEWNTT